MISSYALADVCSPSPTVQLQSEPVGFKVKPHKMIPRHKLENGRLVKDTGTYQGNIGSEIGLFQSTVSNLSSVPYVARMSGYDWVFMQGGFYVALQNLVSGDVPEYSVKVGDHILARDMRDLTLIEYLPDETLQKEHRIPAAYVPFGTTFYDRNNQSFRPVGLPPRGSPVGPFTVSKVGPIYTEVTHTIQGVSYYVKSKILNEKIERPQLEAVQSDSVEFLYSIPNEAGCTLRPPSSNPGDSTVSR